MELNWRAPIARLSRNIDSCNAERWKIGRLGNARRATVGPDLRAGRWSLANFQAVSGNLTGEDAPPARATAGSLSQPQTSKIRNSTARSKYSLALGGHLLTHSRAVVAGRTFRSVLVSNSRRKTAKKLTRMPAARTKKEGCAEASINGHAR